MKRAYSYLRFSEPRQQWGDSERRQSKLTEDYVSRKKLVLDESLHLTDKGKSAFHQANLAATGRLAAFLQAVETGRVPQGSVLIVENLDRLTRAEIGKALSLFMGILEKGVSIVTLSPEREYTYQGMSENIGHVMEAVMSLFLGHEESRKKSKRVTEEWRERLGRVSQEKMTARCPAWLTLAEDRKSFQVRPGCAAVIRQIFTWAIEGVGIFTITKRLNSKGVAPFATIRNRGKRWHESYVRLILRSRAVLGEYQSHTGIGKTMKPYGPMVPDYFPRIVSDATFYEAQKALKSRRTQMGRAGEEVANLFTGLMKDASDGSPLYLETRSKGAYSQRMGKHVLVSSAAKAGVRGAVYIPFPYKLVEEAVLTWLEEVKPQDILPHDDKGGIEDDIAARSGKLAELEHKIQQTEEEIARQPEIKVLLKMLASLEREKDQELAELERLKTERSGGNGETTGETQCLIRLLRDAKGPEREALRRNLKAKLRLLISEMWYACIKVPYSDTRGRPRTGKAICVQIHFRKGAVRQVFTHIVGRIRDTPGRLFWKAEGMRPGHDIRESLEWFLRLHGAGKWSPKKIREETRRSKDGETVTA